MAERRMFAKTITNSARFLRMPATSRLLYYDLGMNADDDGVVEAFTVLRLTGAQEDDLRVLVSKGYISILNEDLVSLINDWKTNNTIRVDRYRPSVYQNLLVKISECEEEEPVMLEEIPDGIPSDNQRYTNGIPSDNQVSDNRSTQDRIGKERVGKGRIDKDIDVDSDFEYLWSLYPKKDGKKNAKTAYQRAVKKGVTKEQVEDGIRRYIEYIRITGQYIKNGSTWFNQECWNDEYKTEGVMHDVRSQTDARGQNWDVNDNTVI